MAIAPRVTAASAPQGTSGQKTSIPPTKSDQERSEHHGRVDDQGADPVTLLTLEPEPTLPRSAHEG